MIYLGTAGWNIPREAKGFFPAEGSHLERYAARFNAVEINSSFYRPHRAQTYERWARTVPDEFRFSVKLPKQITHKQRLIDAGPHLAGFLSQTTSLGSKLGVILIQLPPSFAFDNAVARSFFQELRRQYRGAVAFEPRHATWFTTAVDTLLMEFQVARVKADPAPVPEASEPGGWPGIVYFRLHGSPRIYYSQYEEPFLGEVAADLSGRAGEKWCIFDNTALGFAAGDALRFSQLMRGDRLTEC